MNKEFIPYEQALALKELGFDEPCFYQYVRDFDNDGELIPIISETNHHILRNNHQVSHCSGGDCFAAPLYQQVFRWFREKYNLMFQIFYLRNGNYAVIIHRTTPEYMDLVDQINPSSGCVDEVVDCYSYEEAELACLVKLIEIVKQK